MWEGVEIVKAMVGSEGEGSVSLWPTEVQVGSVPALVVHQDLLSTECPGVKQCSAWVTVG